MRKRSEPEPEETKRFLAKPTMSYEEAAAVVGCGASALRAAMRTGAIQLDVIAIGTRRVITTASVKRLLGEPS